MKNKEIINNFKKLNKEFEEIKETAIETQNILDFIIKHGKDEVVINIIREGYMDYRYAFKCIYNCKLRTYNTGILVDSMIKGYKEPKILKNGNCEIIFKHRDFYYKVDKESGECMNIPEPLFVSQELKENK